ncbi:TetR/AcrR family transcriptional regulator [Actinotalea fermentans]|uniref:TetR/AcrR family transcriptional regulator n=1 Tax=Actinotalea fermentans TaxID=43671 RepID=UPI00054F3CD9|nr:TetR/AcrR family transcriptional regulator [Actinotalea fermentans]
MIERNGLQSGSQDPAPEGALLPVVQVGRPADVPRGRADAARNRARVLDAAQALFAERGVQAVTMDDVARAAGVGKGTLYRGFGDRAGLAMALLDDRARAFQAAVLDGPAPLGPGAPADDRLVAFVLAYFRFQADHLELVLESEAGRGPGARLAKGSYRFWRQHVAWLLQEAGAPHAGTRAEVLLGALAADQVRHWLVVVGRPADAVAAELAAVARSLLR